MSWFDILILIILWRFFQNWIIKHKAGLTSTRSCQTETYISQRRRLDCLETCWVDPPILPLLAFKRCTASFIFLCLKVMKCPAVTRDFNVSRVSEPKGPLHRLCRCIYKRSGNACIMWNNLTYASLFCERRRVVQFTACPRWPAIESWHSPWLPSVSPSAVSTIQSVKVSGLPTRFLFALTRRIIDKSPYNSPLYGQQRNQVLLWNISPVCQQLPWRFCADTPGLRLMVWP